MKRFLKVMFSSSTDTSIKRVIAFIILNTFIVSLFWGVDDKYKHAIIEWLGWFFIICIGGSVAEKIAPKFKRK